MTDYFSADMSNQQQENREKRKFCAYNGFCGDICKISKGIDQQITKKVTHLLSIIRECVTFDFDSSFEMTQVL